MLHRFDQGQVVFDTVVSALVIEGLLAGPGVAQYLQVFIGTSITGILVEEVAIALLV